MYYIKFKIYWYNVLIFLAVPLLSFLLGASKYLNLNNFKVYHMLN